MVARQVERRFERNRHRRPEEYLDISRVEEAIAAETALKMTGITSPSSIFLQSQLSLSNTMTKDIVKAIGIAVVVSVVFGILADINRVAAVFLTFIIMWWVYADAKRIGIHRYATRWAFSPHTWVLPTIIFWPVVFIIYLVIRSRILAGKIPLRTMPSS